MSGKSPCSGWLNRASPKMPSSTSLTGPLASSPLFPLICMCPKCSPFPVYPLAPFSCSVCPLDPISCHPLPHLCTTPEPSNHWSWCSTPAPPYFPYLNLDPPLCLLPLSLIPFMHDWNKPWNSIQRPFPLLCCQWLHRSCLEGVLEWLGVCVPVPPNGLLTEGASGRSQHHCLLLHCWPASSPWQWHICVLHCRNSPLKANKTKVQ